MHLSSGSIISFVAGAVVCAAVIGTSRFGIYESQMEMTPETSISAAQQNPTNAQAMRRRAAVANAERAGLPNHEKVECCLKVAEDIDSTLAAKLRQQQERNPDAFAAQLKYQGQRLMDLCDLRSSDPALYSAKLLEMQYDARIIELAAQLCQAADQGNEKRVVEFEQQLLQTLQLQLGFEIKARAEFLLRLEQEVERLRAELDTMGSQYNTTVQTRLAELKACSMPLRPSWQQQSRAVVPVADDSRPPAE